MPTRFLGFVFAPLIPALSLTRCMFPLAQARPSDAAFNVQGHQMAFLRLDPRLVKTKVTEAAVASLADAEDLPA